MGGGGGGGQMWGISYYQLESFDFSGIIPKIKQKGFLSYDQSNKPSV